MIPCDKVDVGTCCSSLEPHLGLSSVVELVMSWSGIVMERREARGRCGCGIRGVVGLEQLIRTPRVNAGTDFDKG